MLSVNYLSHTDFIMVLIWTLLEAVNGSYFDQLARYQADIQFTEEFYGFIPPGTYDDMRKFKREWARYALYARQICVDVETGETYIP